MMLKYSVLLLLAALIGVFIAPVDAQGFLKNINFESGPILKQLLDKVQESTLYNTRNSMYDAFSPPEKKSAAESLATGNINSAAYCSKVLSTSFEAATVSLTYDENNVAQSTTMNCTRQIEYNPNVASISVIGQMIEDDELRVAVVRTLCAMYYRPASAPTLRPCKSLCQRAVSLTPNVTDATPTQRRDAAVMYSVVNQALHHPYYNNSAAGPDAEECPSSIYDDYNETDADSCAGHPLTDMFRPLEETFLVRGSCQRYPDEGVCSNVVSSVYSSPEFGSFDDALPGQDTSVAYREAVYGELALAYAMTPIVPERCDIALSWYACSRLFMPCYELSLPLVDAKGNAEFITYPVPQLSHLDVCNFYSRACESFIIQMTQTDHALASFFYPQCETLSPIGAAYGCDDQQLAGTGLPWHPATTTYESGLGPVMSNNFTHDTQPMADPSITFEPDVICPAPLVKPTNPDTPNRLSDGTCALPCPTIVFDHSDYQMTDVIVIVMAIIGTVCITFLLVTFLCFHEKRHSLNVIPFLCMCTVSSVAILLGVFVLFSGDGDTMASKLCYTNSDQYTMTQSPACATQGFFIVLGMLSLCAWWSISAFDLFMKIVLGVRVPKGSRRESLVNILHYVWGWLIPLVLVTIAAGTSSLGPADMDMTYCFVHAREHEYIPWITTYYPLMIYLVIGAASMGSTLYVLCKATNKLQQTTGTKAKDAWKHYASALIFILLFFIVFFSIILFRAIAFFSDDIWTESATEFVVCLLSDQALYGRSCGSKPRVVPNVGFWIFVQFVIAGSGFFSFLVYGLNSDLYLLWAARVGRVFQIDCCINAGAHTSEGQRYPANATTGQSTRDSTTTSVHTSQDPNSPDGTKNSQSGHHRVPGASAKFRMNYKPHMAVPAQRTHLGSISLSNYATILNTFRKATILDSFTVPGEHDFVGDESLLPADAAASDRALLDALDMPGSAVEMKQLPRDADEDEEEEVTTRKFKRDAPRDGDRKREKRDKKERRERKARKDRDRGADRGAEA